MARSFELVLKTEVKSAIANMRQTEANRGKQRHMLANKKKTTTITF